MKIKAYTLFTDSHKKFLTDYFIPTFPYRKEIELIILHRTQHCKTASFETEGWHETMRDKVNCFIEGIEKCNENEIFMFIDPDIQFFGDFYDDIINILKSKDAVFQNDVFGGVNTGFFAAKNNKKVRSFFKTILGNLDSFSQEQVLANYLLTNSTQFQSIAIDWAFLPAKYWTYGHIAAQPGKEPNTYKGSWTPEADNFNVPSDIIIHHANWTAGIDNKINLLNIVRNKLK